MLHLVLVTVLRIRQQGYTIGTYLVIIFHLNLVISTKVDNERYACDVLELMHQFLPLCVLTSNVNNCYFKICSFERCLGYPSRLWTTIQDVFGIGLIRGAEKTVKVLEVI
jgi:hypothetical protein